MSEPDDDDIAVAYQELGRRLDAFANNLKRTRIERQHWEMRNRASDVQIFKLLIQHLNSGAPNAVALVKEHLQMMIDDIEKHDKQSP